MLVWQKPKTTGNLAEPASAAMMGFYIWMPKNSGAPSEPRGWFPSVWSALQPNRRVRPSHLTGRWAGHYRRWADSRMVPIPMNRGIPFRGDRFGGPFYAAANLSATGV